MLRLIPMRRSPIAAIDRRQFLMTMFIVVGGCTVRTTTLSNVRVRGETRQIEERVWAFARARLGTDLEVHRYVEELHTYRIVGRDSEFRIEFHTESDSVVRVAIGAGTGTSGTERIAFADALREALERDGCEIIR